MFYQFIRKAFKPISIYLFILTLFITSCTPNIVFAALPQRLVNSTVEMTDAVALWTGVIIKQKDNKLYILSVVHDDPEMRLALELGLQKFFVLIEGNEMKEAHLLKWDYCTELALFVVEDNLEEHFHRNAYIAFMDAPIGAKVSTAGNPLGQGIKFNTGTVSAKGLNYSTCTPWNVYGGGTISGQTGSPVFNKTGGVVGLLTAVALTQTPTITLNNLPGMALVPVYHLGYYIPLSTIKGFLKAFRGEAETYLT